MLPLSVTTLILEFLIVIASVVPELPKPIPEPLHPVPRLTFTVTSSSNHDEFLQMYPAPRAEPMKSIVHLVSVIVAFSSSLPAPTIAPATSLPSWPLTVHSFIINVRILHDILEPINAHQICTFQRTHTRCWSKHLLQQLTRQQLYPSERSGHFQPRAQIQ